MKVSKLMSIGAFLVFAGVFVPINAQEAAKGSGTERESEFYVVQVPIEKIWSHNKGYVIQYRKAALMDRKAYLPLSWFVREDSTSEAPKGEIILLGPGKVWPHMSIYYKGGTVDHVRLYLRKEPDHITWGRIDPHSDYDKNFENITDLKIDYK
ncbi:MAG: hypothetical protein LBV68_03390 [Spirochaetaceae bacterium]|nr:hypothetical protein [Spirochaetaceae bacterium]